jgi:hypothetical protein
MGSRIGPRRVVSRWFRAGRLASLAVAACLAMLIYVAPMRPVADANDRQAARAGSIFAPIQWPDLTPRPASAIPMPHVRRQNLRRDWILIPAERPGEFMVVEVNRVTTRMRAIHSDF